MLIGLHGKKSAGKDTVYERASRILADVLPVERASFADLLYRSAAASLDVTVEELQEWKNDSGVFVAVGSRFEDGSFFVAHKRTVREFLQAYGTEAHREVFGPDFWVENVDLSHEGRVVFVTDVRFANEALAVREAGGTVVHVLGPAEVEQAGDGHASETVLPSVLIDMTLTNSQRDDNFRALDKLVDTALKILLRADELDATYRLGG